MGSEESVMGEKRREVGNTETTSLFPCIRHVTKLFTYNHEMFLYKKRVLCYNGISENRIV